MYSTTSCLNQYRSTLNSTCKMWMSFDIKNVRRLHSAQSLKTKQVACRLDTVTLQEVNKEKGGAGPVKDYTFLWKR
jgi:hypothetical protein